jgi:hypothetical protein
MADLATVFGNTGDTGLNNTGMNNTGQGPHRTNPNNSPHNLSNNLKNDNEQYNNPSTQPNTNTENDVDQTINKLKTHLENQKKIKTLKDEIKSSKNNDSIIDKYIKKKKDVLKLLVMVLLVVLALSMHDIIKVYLNKYILSKDLTNREELYFRLAIPLTIYFIVWSMKAFSK